MSGGTPKSVTMAAVHGTSFPIGDSCIIGRDRSCDIVLTRRFINRRHARIDRYLTSYFIEDLQSTCGTQLNGKRLIGSSPLEDGDVITIGNYLFRFSRGTLAGGA
jgi:pSer/pThr/pTyr-binding forkhead associated (FHA) protein